MNRDETESFLRKVAEACGIDFEVVEFDIFKAVVVGGTQRVWNPLTSDTDALGVAAELDIKIAWHMTCVEARTSPHSCELVGFSEDGGDKLAAFRIAVCRQAAKQAPVPIEPPAGREVVDG